MRVLVAGGTGVIGQPLTPALIEGGHGAIVLSRSASRVTAALQAAAEFVEADALQPASTPGGSRLAQGTVRRRRVRKGKLCTYQPPIETGTGEEVHRRSRTSV